MQTNPAIQAPRIPRQWIIRVTGSIVILGLTLWLLPTGQVWEAMRAIPIALWLFVFVIHLLGHVVLAAKWWLLINHEIEVPFVRAMRAHFTGLVSNLCLPGMAGGDVVRAGLVIRKSENKARIAVGSAADRLLDTFVLFLIACSGALFAVGDSSVYMALVKVGAVMVLAAAALTALVVALPRLPFEGIVEQVRGAIDEFKGQPRRLAICIGLSFMVQSVFILLNLALAQASGIDVGAAAWFFAWPLAKLTAIVPISIAGLGVREASLAGLLLPFGAVPAKVVAVSLVWQTIFFGGGLLGGAVLLSSSKINMSSLRSSGREELDPLVHSEEQPK